MQPPNIHVHYLEYRNNTLLLPFSKFLSFLDNEKQVEACYKVLGRLFASIVIVCQQNLSFLVFKDNLHELLTFDLGFS